MEDLHERITEIQLLLLVLGWLTSWLSTLKPLDLENVPQSMNHAGPELSSVQTPVLHREHGYLSSRTFGMERAESPGAAVKLKDGARLILHTKLKALGSCTHDTSPPWLSLLYHTCLAAKSERMENGANSSFESTLQDRGVLFPYFKRQPFSKHSCYYCTLHTLICITELFVQQQKNIDTSM